MLLSPLHVGVIASSVFSLVALLFLVARTYSFGRRPLYANAQGKGGRGVFYAFAQGMMPWEKESAAKHLLTLVAGVFYHAAIFAALAFLVLRLTSVPISSIAEPLLRIVLAVGLACGLGLLAKRAMKPYLRAISTLDDVLANLLIDLFLAAALLCSWFPNLEPAFFIVAIVLFLYIPLGKIRHCFFFFYSRILFGAFVGRRGVLPHPPREA
jgi:hypothetical protein